MILEIGPLAIKINKEDKFKADKTFSQYEIHEKKNIQHTINIKKGKIKKEVFGKYLFGDSRVKVFDQSDESIEKRYYFNPVTGVPYAETTIYNDYSDIVVQKEFLETKDEEYLYLMCLALDKIALFHDSFIFHSASILIDNKIILFSGPSGIGKSTQAELWGKYKNAVIVNGDRNLLYKKDGKLYCQGWIESGSSEHRKNISAPVKAIVMLQQGKENKLRGIKNSYGARRILQEMIVNSWDFKFVDSALEFLNDIIKNNEIYELCCTPDERAVNCLESIL